MPDQLALLEGPTHVTFGCTELFPDQPHCPECHALDEPPFLAADRRGQLHACCCEGVAILKAFRLLRDPSFWPEPDAPTHRRRLKAWITR